MINRIKHVAHNNTPRWVVLMIDMLLAILSFSIACIVIETFHNGNFTLKTFAYPLALVLIFRLTSFLITKSYTGIIKYTSTQDAIRIFFAVAISTLGIAMVEGLYFYSLEQHLLNPTVIIIDAFILVFLLSAFRLGFKILYSQYAPSNSFGTKQLIVYGAGEAGVLVKRSVERDNRSNKKVIAFLDDNHKLQGKSVEGVKIYSSDIDLDNLILEHNDVELIIAINNISSIRKNE